MVMMKFDHLLSSHDEGLLFDLDPNSGVVAITAFILANVCRSNFCPVAPGDSSTSASTLFSALFRFARAPWISPRFAGFHPLFSCARGLISTMLLVLLSLLMALLTIGLKSGGGCAGRDRSSGLSTVPFQLFVC